MLHTTGIYRNTEHSKYNGVTVNNTLDLSKTRKQSQSDTDSHQMDFKNITCQEPESSLAPGLSELDSLESQVQALESEIQSNPLQERFLGSTSTFSCSVCLKGFKSESDLNDHERTYHKSKKYTCDICHKGFTRKFNMVTHRQLHFEIRQHTCRICKKGYTRRDRLLMHYQSCHGPELGISIDNMQSTEQMESPATSL